jgi:choline dehydrogenase-like flavoprotein
MIELHADYVIIGAGSAGCVLADRLSEDGAQVVLLEAGPTDWHPMIHVPAGALHLRANPLVNWNYYAEPGGTIGNRSMHWPRGRVLGGTSSINGMLYVRGNPADYDGWAQMGCRGWSYDDVLPYFKKSEHYVQGGDAEVRGQGGPLKVEDYRTILPLTHRFVEGAQQARASGAYCVGISDTYVSPLARVCDELFLASIESTSFGASYTAPIALANALLAAIGQYRHSRTLALAKEIAEEQRKGFRWYTA